VNRAYRIAPAARDDLDGIWEYLTEHRSVAAADLFKKLKDTFWRLSEFPHMGRLRNELLDGLRSFPIGKYIVFYRPIEDGSISIEIIRVLHGARDIPSQFN